MAQVLETAVFWHPDPRGGGHELASSYVGPSPLHVGLAHQQACEGTGHVPARSYQSFQLTFPEMPQDPREGLGYVHRSYDACARCHLSAERFQVCQYRGSPDASIVFYGEGPGKDENDFGKPFIGRSGKLQDAICYDHGIEPEHEVFWFNAVGCRPAPMHQRKDRPPTHGEMLACSERALMLFRAVRPRVVVCLGKASTSMFWEKPPPVWSWHRFSPPDAPQDWIMVGHAYHPAYLVRVIGSPKMYREYAAMRSFYRILSANKSALQKVSRWRFFPRLVYDLQEGMVACPTLGEEEKK